MDIHGGTDVGAELSMPSRISMLEAWISLLQARISMLLAWGAWSAWISMFSMDIHGSMDVGAELSMLLGKLGYPCF